MSDHASTPRCLNCGRDLDGRYCSQCGQEAGADPSVRRWLGDLAEDLFNLDSRAWCTLRALMTSPGRLSEEYRAGRRVRWVAPTRLYLITSLLFFAAMEFAPEPVARISGAPPLASETSRPPPAAMAPDGQLESAPPIAVAAREGLQVRAGRFWSARMERAAAYPDRLNRYWVRGITWSMFLLIPAFALLLRLAWWRPPMAYVYHLVFALHVHAFTFLLLAAAQALAHPMATLGDHVLQLPPRLAFIVSVGYIVLAARRFYGTGVASTALRVALVGLGYILTLTASALVVLGAVLLMLS